MRRSVVGGLVLALSLAAGTASAQTRAALTGRVLDQSSREPVRAAVVELAKKN